MNVARRPTEQTTNDLFEVLQELSRELHPGQKPRHPVGLDSTLDRDLGFDSLGRMELLHRLEAHFDIGFPERTLAEAETVRDLLRAILQAGVGRRPGALEPQTDLETGPGEAAPSQARTLPEVLDWHLANQPDRPHIRFYADRGPGSVITYRQLHQGAVKVAAGLQKQGLVPGTPVAIMLPSEASYFFAFWGVLLAGGMPVPIYPPTRMAQMEEHLKRQQAILGNCRATHLITLPEALLFGRLLKSNLPQLQALLTVDELTDGGGEYTVLPLQENDTAFLQYTSGATGNPKGVVLTHASLLANIRAMGRAVEVDDSDVVVSWLPLYHDMGLIGCWLSSLYFATQLVLLSPLDFLSRPVRWLHAIHRYGGTLSPAPNFAYEICLSRLSDKDLDGLDLSSWRCAFNGAEAVSPTSVERFCNRFADYGFRPEAMMPVYGLAEDSVGLAFPPIGRAPLIEDVNREIFTRSGRAVPVPAGTDDCLRFVACGRPLPKHEIRVVDRAGHEIPEQQVGRVQFRGPSACSGYYRNSEATAELFDGDWLNTGDLGYISAGEIFITGRSKDLIIIAGRNIYPQELEEAIAELPGIRKGNVAVIGSRDPGSGSERLVVVAETRETSEQTLTRLRDQITELAVQLLGNPPHDLLLTPPQTIPKTSSGKIRRAATCQRYEQGQLGRELKHWRQVVNLVGIGLSGQLRRGRHAAAGIAFAIWSRGLYYLLIPPVYLAVLLLPTIDWRWGVTRRVLRLLARATATPLRVEGLEHLPEGPCVLVANHASYLDGYALVAALPERFGFVAKRELAENPLVRIPLERLGTEFVDRFDQRQGLEDARRLGQRAAEGCSLMFFPEGTFTRIPGLRSFHMGAFVTAAEADLPLVPIVIRGTRSMLRGDEKFPHRGAISIQLGPTIRSKDLPAASSNWKRAVQLRDACRKYILRHCAEPDLEQQ